MNRRGFLGMLLGALALPFARGGEGTPKGGAGARDSLHSDLPMGSFVVKRRPERVGYVAINVENEDGSKLIETGDWMVTRPDGTSIGSGDGIWIQRANDREGWYEHLVRDVRVLPNGNMQDHSRTVHVKADIRIVYTGKDPRYMGFQAQS